MLAAKTIWELYRHYLQADCQYAERTIKAYRWVFWAWVGFLAAQRTPLRWNQLGPKTGPKLLQQFLNQPPTSGRAHGDHLAPNTRLHYAATICAFYAWAVAAEHLRRDPMAVFRLPKGGQPQARSFSFPELRQILLLAEATDPRLHVMAALAYGAGLRCGEIAALDIRDVHLDPARAWLLVNGKGGKKRSVPFGPEVRSSILRMLIDRGNPRVGPLVESRVQPGEHMTPQSVSRALSDHIRKTCGIDGSGHGLRHSYAVELLEAGGEDQLLTVARLLGHARTATTEQTYLLGYKGDAAALVSKLPYPTRRT